MERLSHWRTLDREDLSKVESPFFARSIVKDVLEGHRYPYERDALSRLCGTSLATDLAKLSHEDVLWQVERAMLLLVRDDVINPINVRDYGHLTWCRPKECFHEESPVHSGPGKWVTVKVEADGLRSGVAVLANWVTSRGDEGRLFFSAGKDYANTVQTVTQQWVMLAELEQGVAHRSVSRWYGAERKIRQIYVEADDPWQVSGKSWHWRPVVAHESYEYKDGER